MKYMFIFFTLLIFFLFLSCEAGYNEKDIVKTKEEVPQTMFTNYKNTVIENGYKTLEFSTDLAKFYFDSKKAILKNVDFKQSSKIDGKILTQGHADDITYNTDNDDAELSGRVKLSSSEQDVIIEGEYINWKNTDKRIESKNDAEIKVTRGDGSFLKGYGFSAEIKPMIFSFTKGIQGYIIEKNKK